MTPHKRLALVATSLLLAATATAQLPLVIMDTDFAPDCDDVGALGVLHKLADRGECHILGVMVSSRDPWAARGVDAVNTWYGRPNVPIGVYGGTLVPLEYSYSGHLAHEFPNDESPDPEFAVSLYRRILAASPDNSVQIATTGYLVNLHDLLASSADSLSPFSGAQLIQRKVAGISIVGGRFPTSGFEFNLHAHGLGLVSRNVVQQLEAIGTNVTFCGLEIGDNLWTGDVVRQFPDTNPVGRAYDYWLDLYAQATGRPQHNRPAWDHTSIMHAVRGLNGVWTRVTTGSIDISSSGAIWRSSPDSNQSYLRYVNSAQGSATLQTTLRQLQQAAPTNPQLAHSTIETFNDGTSGEIHNRNRGVRTKVRFGKLELDNSAELIVSGRRSGDQTIIARIEMVPSPVYATVGFTLRAPSRDGGWSGGPRIHIEKNAGGALFLYMSDFQSSGQYGPVTSWLPISPAAGEPFALRIDAYGTQVTASVDGNVVLPTRPISAAPTPLTYTFIRPTITQGGAYIDFMLLREAGQGPAISVDKNGTTWFSEVEAGPLAPAPIRLSGVLLNGGYVDAVIWKYFLRLVESSVAVESLGTGSHFVYGLHGVAWPPGSNVTMLHNNAMDGSWVLRDF